MTGGDAEEEREEIVLQLKEACVPQELLKKSQEEGSPRICGTDVAPCSALAMMWAEQQQKLDQSNEVRCKTSPAVLMQLHWSPKGFASPVDTLLEELSGSSPGLIPLLLRNGKARVVRAQISEAAAAEGIPPPAGEDVQHL